MTEATDPPELGQSAEEPTAGNGDGPKGSFWTLARRRPRKRWAAWKVVVSTVVVIALIISAVLAWVRVPYFAVGPGPTRDAAELISVEGIETYDHDGALILTTVSIAPVNGWRLITTMFDDSAELVTEESVNGGKSNAERDAASAAMMNNSIVAATDVALRHVGVEVELVGKGAKIRSVVEGAPSADVLQVGDIVVSANGAPITVAGDLPAALSEFGVGDVMTLDIRRGDEELTVDAPLYPSADDAERAILGIEIVTEDIEVITPNSDVEVDIAVDGIGGPSAGLVYALQIINKLTPDDITHGRVIAATGEISADGTVGAIGGVAQKVVSVDRAGASVFLVPTANVSEALLANVDIEVVGVATLDEALTYLSTMPG